METESKQIVEKKVYEEGKKDYASKGMAGTALGFGIAGTALGLWGASRRGFPGAGMPENVNINTLSETASGRQGFAPTAFQVWEKECEDSLKLTNTIWGLKVNTLEQMYKHRDTDVTEKFGLWKSQVDGNMENYKTMRNLYDHMSEKLNETAFGLYKGQRDLYDTLNERYSNKFNELDKKVYGMEVANLYQNKIIQMGMDSVLKESVCYTDRKTCRAIYGVVGLPSTPAVSVLEGASPFGCSCQRVVSQTTEPNA